MDYHVTWCIMWSVILTRTGFCAGTCVFPSDLRGVWHSAEKGDLTFTDSLIYFYPMFLSANVSSVNWWCNQTHGSKYILSGNETFEVFGEDRRPYLCIELTQISQDVFIYYVGTKIESSNNDRVFVRVASEAIVPDAVCNRPLPWEPSTFVTLVKQDANLTSYSRTCPDVLLRNFQNVSIESADDSESCYNVTMDVCTSTSIVNVSNKACNPALTFSDTGDYACVYDLIFGEVTFVSLWNLDNTTTDGKTYRTTCYAVKEEGSESYATEHPGICHYNQTHTYVPSPGVALRLSQVTENCVPTSSRSPSAESDDSVLVASIIGGAAGSVMAFLAFILICIACKLKNKGKATKEQTTENKQNGASVSVECLEVGDESPMSMSYEENRGESYRSSFKRSTPESRQKTGTTRCSDESSYASLRASPDSMNTQFYPQTDKVKGGKPNMQLEGRSNRSTPCPRSASPEKLHFQTSLVNDKEINQKRHMQTDTQRNQNIELMGSGNLPRSASPLKVHFQTSNNDSEINLISNNGRNVPSQNRSSSRSYSNDKNGVLLQTLSSNKLMTKKSPYEINYKRMPQAMKDSNKSPYSKPSEETSVKRAQRTTQVDSINHAGYGNHVQSDKNPYSMVTRNAGDLETKENYHNMALAATDNYKLLLKKLKRNNPSFIFPTDAHTKGTEEPETVVKNTLKGRETFADKNWTSNNLLHHLNMEREHVIKDDIAVSPDSGLHTERTLQSLRVNKVDVATSPIIFDTLDDNNPVFRPWSVRNRPNSMKFSNEPNAFKSNARDDAMKEYRKSSAIGSGFAASTFTSLSVVPAVIAGYEMAKYNPPNIKRRQNRSQGTTDRDQIWCIHPISNYKNNYSNFRHYGSSKLQHPSNAYGRFKVRSKAIIPWR